MRVTADGGCIIAAKTDSWLIIWKCEEDGTIEWAKHYDDANNAVEEILSIAATADGGYTAIGSTGYSALLVLKLEENGELAWAKTYALSTSVPIVLFTAMIV